MNRRGFLKVTGTIGSVVAIAGCGSVEMPDDPFDEGPTDRRTSADTAEVSTQPQGSDTTTERVSTRSITERSTPASTTQRTPTTRPTRTATQVTTPDPPANRLLPTEEVGERWRYADGSAPTERGNGTITAVYVTTRGFPARLRLRLWPCEGQSLENLGGTCSLGNLPERYRAMEGVETGTPAVGESAFAWWEGTQADIEVVASNHVFRLTFTPRRSTNIDGPLAKDPALQRLLEIAHRQVRHLARVTETE